ncbi:MAG: hypothetical protein IKB95_08160 [Bacteroidales bacterium]|nr:hypothetical protein [Bacteroidales bacterium]
MKNYILMFLLLCCMYPSYAQQTRIINGKVRAFNDLPVSGLKVTAKKAQSAVNTDSSGNFSIACLSTDCITVKSECFKTVNIKINQKSGDSITVKLVAKANEKSVDMAIGYGYLKEEDRTQAVQSLRKGPDYSSYSSVYDIIKSNFTGVDVRPDGCIITRSTATVYGDPCAAFVVNGAIVDSIDYLSPGDIKEISLIKDGTAAIYGARSGNGVFIINTR